MRSEAEIAAAIQNFTPAEWARLRLTARRYSMGGRLDPKELLQEAMLRALTPKTAHLGRHCPSDVDVPRFLTESIRSIASGEWEKISRHAHAPVVGPGGHVLGAVDLVEDRENAEEALARHQDEQTRRQALLELFADDDAARDIIDGEISGMTKLELEALTGLSGQAYDSKRRLIRRRLAKRFPDGFTP